MVDFPSSRTGILRAHGEFTSYLGRFQKSAMTFHYSYYMARDEDDDGISSAHCRHILSYIKSTRSQFFDAYVALRQLLENRYLGIHPQYDMEPGFGRKRLLSNCESRCHYESVLI